MMNFCANPQQITGAERAEYVSNTPALRAILIFHHFTKSNPFARHLHKARRSL